MRSDHHRLLAFPGQRSDDAVLSPRMLEVLNDTDRPCGTESLIDLIKQPLGRLSAVVAFIVSGVKASKGFEMLPHILLIQALEQLRDCLVLGRFLGIRDLVLARKGRHTRILMIRDIEEANAITSERPLLVLGHPSSIGWRELDQVLLATGEWRLLEDASVEVAKGGDGDS